jgi:hypothetical protein
VVATTITDVYGTLAQGSFPVPALRSGNYNVNANDGVAASPVVIFAIRPRLILSTTEGSVDDQIILTGSGFDYNSGINTFWDNQLVSTNLILSNSTGSFTGNFSIPVGTVGSHMIKVSDFTSRIATVSFTVVPKISLNPNNSAPGNTVTLTGKGFRLNTSITVTYSGITVQTQPQTVITDASGSFSATFFVPSGTSGNYLVRASDGAFAATATFGVTSKIEVLPATGNVGTELRINGIGFTPSGRVTLSYDAQEVATINVDATGSFTASFKAPASKAGAHNISARDQTVSGLVITATFTMEATPPPKPNLIAPEPGSQTATTPKFAWSEVTDPSGVTYSLQVALNAAFSNTLLSKPGLTTPEYTVIPAEAFGLAKKTSPYYWKVKAIDGAGNESDWSATGTFYTQDSTPPPLPLLLSPPNDSQANVRPALDWSDVSDPSGVTYSLQVAQDSAFSRLVVVKEGLQTSEYKLSKTEKLSSATGNTPDTYYWRVKASDGAGNESSWSNSNEFRVRNFLQSGWPVYTAIAIGGLLLLALGVFIGMRLKTKAPI